MNRSPQNGLKSLSIEKLVCFLIKKPSEKVSAWRNLFWAKLRRINIGYA